MIRRTTPVSVALETTLLAHGVPAGEAMPLYEDLARIVADAGAHLAPVGVLRGDPIVGLTPDEMRELLAIEGLPKLNTANLGLALARGGSGATTVSATMELAAAAGIGVFATGGIGGVHHGYGQSLDISSDLAALARFPVVVVASGVKSILDVVSTREALESLGVPVVGYRTDRFPAFYLRESTAGVDGRFDDARELASFCRAETNRAGRGVLVVHPTPEEDAIEPGRWHKWLQAARAEAAESGSTGRDVTPAVLAALHRISEGETLRVNLALVRANARLAAEIAAAGAR